MRIPGSVLPVRDLSELESLSQDDCRTANHVRPEQSFQVEHLRRAMGIHGVRAGERGELGSVAAEALPARQGEHAQHVERLAVTRWGAGVSCPAKAASPRRPVAGRAGPAATWW